MLVVALPCAVAQPSPKVILSGPWEGALTPVATKRRRAVIYHGETFWTSAQYWLMPIRLIGSIAFTVPAATWLIGQGPEKSSHGHGDHSESHEEPAEESAEEESKDEPEAEDNSKDDTDEKESDDEAKDSKDESKDQAKEDSKDDSSDGETKAKAEPKDVSDEKEQGKQTRPKGETKGEKDVG
jgi:hypothetical protein